MPVKHSFNILISKYGLVYKVIFYYAIALLVIVSIAAAILAPIFSEISQDIQSTGIFEKVHEFVREFLDGEGSISESFAAVGNAVNLVISKIQSNNTAVTKGLAVIGICFVVLFYLVALAHVVTSDVVNNFMNSNSRFGFVSNFFYNLRRSSLYALLYLVTYLPATIITLMVGYFVAYGLWHSGALLLALPVAIMVFLVLQSLVLTVFSGWIPSMVVDNHSVTKALVAGPKLICKHFGYCWMSMFTALFINFILLSAAAVFTFGFGIIIAFPTTVVIIKILELVLYYNVNGYKFYETDKTVAEEIIRTDDQV